MPSPSDPMTAVCVTGTGYVVPTTVTRDDPACDSTPYLRVRKNRKYMGLQDDMAVIAAGRALQRAGLTGDLGERTGLYLCVGYIPFDESDLQQILDGSLEDGHFSMPRFAQEAVARARPLLTFRCLPNMPAFHISVNFDVQGPYLVTYPGPGQLYQALEEAALDVRHGRVERALVVGVAHQRNFLVRHHLGRLEPPVLAEQIADAAGCLVLETKAAAAARGAKVLLQLQDLQISYAPDAPAPLLGDTRAREADALGAAALPVWLGRAVDAGAGPQTLHHSLCTRDGFRCSSAWGLS